MKKVLMIVLVVIVVAAAGIGVYFYQTSRVKLAIEEVLPQGPWAYARFSNIEKRLTEFKATKLWRNINAIDVPMLMEKSGSTQKQIEASGYTTLKKFLSDPNTNMLFMKFFGREAAICLYPVEMKELESHNWEDVASSLIVVTRLSPDLQVAETLSGLLKAFDADLKLTTEEYKSYKINLIEIPQKKIKVGYVRIKDLLIIGFSDQVPKLCIDVISKEKLPLVQDPTFMRVQAKYLPAAPTVMYGNLESVYSDILKLIIASDKNKKKEDQAQLKKEMDQVMAKVAGLKAFGYSTADSPIETHKFDIIYDKDKLDPQVKKLYACAPQENKTIRFVPQNVLGYQWSNCFDLRTQWETVKEELKNAPDEDAKGSSAEETIAAALEKSLKLTIEGDILPAFGNELGGYLSDISLQGMVPFPKLLLFVKIADRSAAERVLSAVTAHPQIVWQNDNYKEVQIKYTALPLGEDFQPGYCFLNDYLLLATSRQTLKESIDALNTAGTSLDSSVAFKNVNFGLTDQNNSVLFVKLDGLLNRIQRMIEWWVAQAKARGAQQQAFKEGIEQRLEDSKKDLQKEEGELKTLQTSLQSTNDQLKNLRSQGLDVAEILTKIDHLEKEIESKKESIQKNKDNQADMEETIQSFKEEKANPELTGLYVNQVVFPIVDGLSSYKAIGSKAISTEDAIESMVYIKKEE